ncbi:hypothetical protein BKA63DRAFT_533946 [Paraphoma chrysanthemicola]|nr:hypothetical protein BKA63DRAFT_533946 [Paraphoma chrysanthemicola]
MGKVKQHQFDILDERLVDELLWELQTIQDIISLSHQCSMKWDRETGWDNRVYIKVLELALGNDETSVGFRSVIAARITPEYRHTHLNSLITGKILAYAIHLEPSGPARDIIPSLIGIVVALLRPGHALKRSPPIEFAHAQTGFEYSDLPFGSLGKHGEYGADISADQGLKGAKGLIRWGLPQYGG